MYWAMYAGDGLASLDTFACKRPKKREGAADDTASSANLLQSRLKELTCLDAAELSLPFLHSWRTAADADDLTLWWGPGGHTEQLHYDCSANIHFQLRGSKVWRLFPPWV